MAEEKHRSLWTTNYNDWKDDPLFNMEVNITPELEAKMRAAIEAAESDPVLQKQIEDQLRPFNTPVPPEVWDIIVD